MKKDNGYSILLIIVFLTVVVGLVFYFSNNKKEEGGVVEGTKEDVEKYKATIGNGETRIMETMTSSYIEYSSEHLVMASNGPVVLFFRASWCPTCRNLNKDIKSHLNDIPKNMVILDVDYDKHPDLKKKYGVTYQHTLVQVNSKGEMISKWSGSPTLDELLTHVK